MPNDDSVSALIEDLLGSIKKCLGVEAAIPDPEPPGWRQLERIIKWQPSANKETLKKLLMAFAVLSSSNAKGSRISAPLPAKSNEKAIDALIRTVLDLIKTRLKIQIPNPNPEPLRMAAA